MGWRNTESEIVALNLKCNKCDNATLQQSWNFDGSEKFVISSFPALMARFFKSAMYLYFLVDLYAVYIQTIFADNVVPIQPLFAGPGIYVCKPLQLIKSWLK